MKIYAQIGQSYQQIGGECPNNFIEMESERPTPNHVARDDGTWSCAEVPIPTVQEHEQIDPAVLDLAEAVLELSAEIEKMKGDAKQ